MIILNDKDKSAYGTLKGLVQILEKDVADRRNLLRSYSESSRDYAACKGAIGAYNDTIGLIYVTDIWVAGQRDELEAQEPKPHWHATTPDTEYLASEPDMLRVLLTSHSISIRDPFSMVEAGYSVRKCSEEACLTKGNWVAQPNGYPGPLNTD